MIAGLDGLRAVAFLIVFFFHTRNLPFGWMGVQLFFVLSGFLITNILLRMKDQLPRREFFVKFYGRRFLRIFPLYYFYLALLAALIFLLPALGLKSLNAELGKSFLTRSGWRPCICMISFMPVYFLKEAASSRISGRFRWRNNFIYCGRC
ncbi:MAG: acyltransferase [Anaerolineales bacterium]|uniref:acyltransferase family protein n=1 Tax=Candidatus Villigracilis proximus TaxID=3140683 RepID=UPI003136D254|nr:acyltransferase [Anaerolineales bacterium]